MSFYSKLSGNYWRFGFKSRLYDWLTPEAYSYTLERALEHVPVKERTVWFDVGCGSGILLPFLKERLVSGERYIGADILGSGLHSARLKAKAIDIGPYSSFFRSDLSDGVPLRHGSVDVVLAYFSIYTIQDSQKRKRLLGNIKKILRPGGKLVLVCPSRGYDARRIIRSSEVLLERQRDSFVVWLKKRLIYPLTWMFGLKFIEHQLSSGRWKAYSLEELTDEIRSAGFCIKLTESVYAQSAFLVIAE